MSNPFSFWSRPHRRTPHSSPLWRQACAAPSLLGLSALKPPSHLTASFHQPFLGFNVTSRPIFTFRPPGLHTKALSSPGTQEGPPHSAFLMLPCDTVTCFFFRLLTRGYLQLKSGLILHTLQRNFFCFCDKLVLNSFFFFPDCSMWHVGS